jgi:hypothetical protein
LAFCFGDRKECKREYYQANKASILRLKKEYRQDNLPLLRERDKQFYSSHKEEKLEYRRSYYEENKEQIKKNSVERQYTKKYREKNPEKVKLYNQEYGKNYRANNKEKIRKKDRKYETDRRQNDPSYRLRKNISRSINFYLSKVGLNKMNSCMDYISFSIQELITHIEKQFEPWMSWNNQGKYQVEIWKDDDISTWTWQLDHIIPQSSFDFSKPEEIKKCWELSNLRPYSAKLNVIEGDRKVVGWQKMV